MKEFFMYGILPVLVCLWIMLISANVQCIKISREESAWMRMHGKKVLWFLAFAINLISLYCLLLYLLPSVDKQKITEISEMVKEVPADSIQSPKKSNKSGQFVTHVTLTTYNPVVGQCDSDPLVTADGTKIDLNKLKKGEIRYCAVSRDLLWLYPYGSVIEIEGHGLFEVRDTMNKRFNHCIDILQHVGKKNFKKTKVKVVKIK